MSDIDEDRATPVPPCPKCGSKRVGLNERMKIPGENPYRGYWANCWKCGYRGASGTAQEAASWPTSQ